MSNAGIASIGVAELCSCDGFETLFNRADVAVYQAKETGRNKVVLTDYDLKSEQISLNNR